MQIGGQCNLDHNAICILNLVYLFSLYLTDYDWTSDSQTVRARQVTEVISGTLASVAKYPLGECCLSSLCQRSVF